MGVAPADPATEERNTRAAGKGTDSDASVTSQFSNVKVGIPGPAPPLGATPHPGSRVASVASIPLSLNQGLLWKRLRDRKGRAVPKTETTAVADGERYGPVGGGRDGGGDTGEGPWWQPCPPQDPEPERFARVPAAPTERRRAGPHRGQRHHPARARQHRGGEVLLPGNGPGHAPGTPLGGGRGTQGTQKSWPCTQDTPEEHPEHPKHPNIIPCLAPGAPSAPRAPCPSPQGTPAGHPEHPSTAISTPSQGHPLGTPGCLPDTSPAPRSSPLRAAAPLAARPWPSATAGSRTCAEPCSPTRWDGHPWDTPATPRDTPRHPEHGSCPHPCPLLSRGLG